jgi:putative ABC transport system permease protein
VLAAPRLLALLNLKVGDRIDVGDTTLRIAIIARQRCRLAGKLIAPAQTATGLDRAGFLHVSKVSEDALGRSMQRAQQFLLLSALLTLLLAIAAVAVASGAASPENL